MSRQSCVGLPSTPVSLRRPPPRARRAASTARVSQSCIRHGATCCRLTRWTELYPRGGQRTEWPRSQPSTTPPLEESAPRVIAPPRTLTEFVGDVTRAGGGSSSSISPLGSLLGSSPGEGLQ